MSVRYKFKDDKRWKTVAFDSAVISVLDLKRAIVQQLKELQPDEDTNTNMIFTNAQTGERYVAENFLIPKNTSVDVRKVPGSAEVIARIHEPTVVTILSQTRVASTVTSTNPDAASGADDEMRRLEEVLNQSSYTTGVRHSRPGLLADLASAFEAPAPALAASIAGSGHTKRPQFARTGRPRPGYICHRCQMPGHFIQDCPTNGNTEYNFQRPKPGTGIPLSMLKPVESGQGAYRLEDGTYANIEPNHRAFAEAFSAHDRAEQKIAMERALASAEDLTCQICKKLYDDPTVTNCCYTTFCRACIISNPTCPICQEPIEDIDELNRNPALAQRVEEFMKSQGLTRTSSPNVQPQPQPKQQQPQQRAPIPIFQSTPRYHQRRPQQAMPIATTEERIVRPVEVKQRHIIDDSQDVYKIRRNIDNDYQEKEKRRIEEEKRHEEEKRREAERQREEEWRRDEERRHEEERRRDEDRRREDDRRRKEEEFCLHEAERRRHEEYRRAQERHRDEERRRYDERRYELERRRIDDSRRRQLDDRRAYARHDYREYGRSRSPAGRRRDHGVRR